MASHYANYVRERLAKEVLETEDGFAVYWFLEHDDLGRCVYIEDIYIVPERRKSGAAALLADRIAEEALERGAMTMLGSVAPGAGGATTSLKVLLGYGMELSHVGNDGLIYFKKSLED